MTAHCRPLPRPGLAVLHPKRGSSVWISRSLSISFTSWAAGSTAPVPLALTWWLVQAVCIALMAVAGGTYACGELKEIPSTQPEVQCVVLGPLDTLLGMTTPPTP